jgi:hypothetical protein
VQEVRDVRLRQAGLVGKQRTAEDSQVDTAPRLQPQTLMQLQELRRTHLAAVYALTLKQAAARFSVHPSIATLLANSSRHRIVSRAFC